MGYMTESEAFLPDEDDEVEDLFYCPHGFEVEVTGGACYWCAQEDAYDGDYGD